MKRHIHRAKYYTKHIKNNTRGRLFKRRILKKFTYIGAKRRRIWRFDKNLNQYEKTDKYDWGNFLAYAYKAANVMMSNKIKQQTQKHWNRINDMIQD